MQQPELIPHLFRTEFRKITAVLCKSFGMEHIQMAEDIASETFLSALETWTYQGIPPNPVAWLYKVARNKALNHFQREHFFSSKVSGNIQATSLASAEIEIDWSDQNITDSQLQMLFAVCHPIISAESQVGLALRILCGFGIDEIATAFLTNKETINKRLFRAREKLRSEKVKIEFPPAHEIRERLQNVLTTLYLLFSEGYYSENSDAVIREELCREAMRLTHLLVENEATNRPSVNALLSLMCFHASRFEARKNKNGELILYDEQDQSLWDQELIARGAYYLHEASTGEELTKYHLEAAIAWWLTVKPDEPGKWENLLQLHDGLLEMEYSPLAALNRTYALSKVKGAVAAIAELEKLDLANNPFAFALLGELYTGIDNKKAIDHYSKARSLAKTQPDKQLLERRIGILQASGNSLHR